jgi:hypothetical protein
MWYQLGPGNLSHKEGDWLGGGLVVLVVGGKNGF